jgi:hypothetical protein
MSALRASALLPMLASAGVCLALGQSTPIAIVPVEGAKLTGAMDVAEGKAIIATSGTVTASDKPVTITLPRRGNVRLCSTTKVSLTADSSVPVGEAPGLMLALDRGALEASFATGHNSDVILTPDFRILISGPGTAAVQVRLGAKGDTCVDNRGPNAPYVTVSSVFEGGIYRVLGEQRVMFQHGSLREVVDHEKESCGCPPDPPKATAGNEFPLAQSEGLAPVAQPSNVEVPGKEAGQVSTQFAYDGTKPVPIAAGGKPPTPPPGPVAPSPAKPEVKPEPKPGFFGKIGHFFRKVFGG